MATVVAFFLDKRNAALVLLFFSTLAFGFSIAHLDNFLNLWDEQYHALVAKHMLDNPFRPTLYSVPLLGFDYKNWTGNYIWLHKQPLFLWQIALSLKVFGYNALAVRLPSIILHALIPIFIYRIGKITTNANVGFYAAVCFSVAYYPLELVAGRYPTDHNDVAFLFYVTASFWAWFEYQHTKRLHWLLLIGVFSGCAVLVKWLVGLLVYAVWAIVLVTSDLVKARQLKSYFPLLGAFIVSLVVFIPWQVYTLLKYPKEAAYEFQLNAQHFFAPIEEHGGDVWFHIRALKDIYGAGDAVPFILLAGIFLFLKSVTIKSYRIAIVAGIVLTYLFFTLAATKMVSFCIIVAPFGFLAFGKLLDVLFVFLQTKISAKITQVLIQISLLTTACFLLMDINNIENQSAAFIKPQADHNRVGELKQIAFIKQITALYPSKKWVVFNSAIRLNGHISLMFYTDCIAYDFIPDEVQIGKIKRQAYKIAILDTGNLPEFILDDPAILKLKVEN